MEHTGKRKLNLNKPSFDLNKSSAVCVPCLEGALKIDRKINGRSLNEIKINEIKEIVRSIFSSGRNIA